MTRPGFLVITGVACLLGFATVWATAPSQWNGPLALLTVLLALLAHAAANVLNDYHDALNGADAANQTGLFPFTGGARLIQNGEVTPQTTRRLAWGLLALVVPAGALLAWHSGSGLLLIGGAGLLLGWAYSAPPLALMSRGLGECTVALTWWLVVIGADHALRGQWAALPAWVALSLAGLIANILLINGFPDATSDAAVGKRTLAVRLGPGLGSVVYLGVALGAHAWLVIAVLGLHLPPGCLWGWLSLPLSLNAARLLHRDAARPAALRPAIVQTIAAAAVHGVALATGLALGSVG